MAHDLQKMQQRHHAIVDRALTGRTRSQIAEEFSMSPEGVGNILNSPLVQAELSRRRRDVEAEVKEEVVEKTLAADDVLMAASVNAATKQALLLHSSNERVSQIAAMDILDRTGFPKLSRSENTNQDLRVTLNSDAFERLNEATKLRFGKPCVETQASVLQSGTDN